MMHYTYKIQGESSSNPEKLAQELSKLAGLKHDRLCSIGTISGFKVGEGEAYQLDGVSLVYRPKGHKGEFMITTPKNEWIRDSISFLENELKIKLEMTDAK